MALYVYQGYSRDGKKMSGQIDASSEGGVKEILQRQGVFPISIIPLHKVMRNENFFQKLIKKKVLFKDKILFTKQLQVLLRSGIPLLDALDLLDDQFPDPLHSILVEIKDGIKEGFSFAEGLKRYPDVFENIYVQLVRAGEASGKLEMLLSRLVEYLEKKEEMQKKVSKAMREPLTNIIVILGVVLFLVTSVVPQLMGMFASQGADLPTPTKILMGISSLILNHYIVIALIIVFLILGFLYWKTTKSGAYLYDALLLKLPLIGFFARMNAVVQFSSTLGMLLEAGVRLSEALDIVCDVIDNRVLKDALITARDKIVKQGKITQYLKQTNIFPSMATYLVGTGEESGNLDKMLLEVSKIYGGELSEKADNIVVLIQPIMQLVMAVIVGFIVISIALPMSQMGKVAGI